MPTQDRIETKKEKIKKYVSTLGHKDFMLWETIDRRGVFRGLRQTLHRMGIPLNIPMNSAEITHEYCKEYGDPSIERLDEHPDEYI